MVVPEAIIGSIVGAILGAALNTTLPKLLGVIGENSDARSIMSDLEHIKALIDARLSTGQHVMQELFMDDLRELAYDIQDCMDTYMSKASPVHHEAGVFQTVTRKTISAEFGRELGKFKVKTAELHGKIKGSVPDTRTILTSEEEAHPAADPPARGLLPAISMNDAKEKLDRLLEISFKTRNLKVITLVGFGTLGTTLLARQFYDRTEGSDEDGLRFSLRAWVSAAGENNTAGVLNRVVLQTEKEAGIVNDGEASNPSLDAKRLRRCLQDKRYLIVIEDIDTRFLSHIISTFNWADKKGSRIIVTTTVQSEDTWCRCGNGSSLAVDNTAQFLKIGELTKDEVEKGCVNFRQESLKVLDINYRNLCTYIPEDKDHDGKDVYVLLELLLCFCMLPRDHPVSRDPLLRRWVAEGLVSRDKLGPADICSKPQDDAFKTLSDSNIIQPIEISNNGKVKSCQTNMLMLDRISRKPEFQKLITLWCHEKPKEHLRPLRRLSLHHGEQLTGNLPSLRTMVAFSNANLTDLASYKVLRVLDLKGCAELNHKHVNEIWNLVLLKYLSLGDSVQDIPIEISKLKQLETLDMSRTNTVGVHVEVIQLPCLKHLIGKFRLYIYNPMESGYENIEQFLQEDSKLEKISGFVTDDGNGFPQLMGHMASLRKVKIWCTCADTESLDHLKEGIKKFIDQGSHHGDDLRMSIKFEDTSPQCKELVKDYLQTRGRLTSFKLHGIQLPTFSTKWSSIRQICLSCTNALANKKTWDSTLRSLSSLNGLDYLKLVEDDLGNIEVKGQHLTSLKRICLVGVKRLHNIVISPGAMYFLSSIQILSKNLEVKLVEHDVDRPGIDIRSHERIEEVALHSGVKPDVKDTWQKYAAGHPKRPKVLFIESGPDPPTGPGSVATTSGATASTVAEAIPDDATTSTPSALTEVTPNEAQVFTTPASTPNGFTPPIMSQDTPPNEALTFPVPELTGISV